MALWVMISYVLSLLTLWIKPLRFLGEGQRYLELSAFPSAYLAMQYLFSTARTPFGIVGLVYAVTGFSCVLTILVIQQKGIVKDTLRTYTKDMEAMFAYIRTVKPKPRLFCIPHQITTNTIYHTGCDVLVNADYRSIEKISDIYPFLKIPVKDVMKKYGLTMILLNTEYASIGDLHLRQYVLLYQVGSYVLLKLKD
jgi:hypothetical protein